MSDNFLLKKKIKLKANYEGPLKKKQENSTLTNVTKHQFMSN